MSKSFNTKLQSQVNVTRIQYTYYFIVSRTILYKHTYVQWAYYSYNE